MKEAAFEKMLVLLHQKKEVFLEYERATKDILDGEADTAENYIMKRSELANEIDFLTDKIGKLCDAEYNTEILLDIVNARCNYEIVPAELREIYGVGQEVRAVISRIVAADELVVAKLEFWREEATEKIKEGQNLPKIKKYLTDLTEDSKTSNRIKINKI